MAIFREHSTAAPSPPGNCRLICPAFDRLHGVHWPYLLWEGAGDNASLMLAAAVLPDNNLDDYLDNVEVIISGNLPQAQNESLTDRVSPAPRQLNELGGSEAICWTWNERAGNSVQFTVAVT